MRESGSRMTSFVASCGELPMLLSDSTLVAFATCFNVCNSDGGDKKCIGVQNFFFGGGELRKRPLGRP
jgi:hypothetical protein